MGMLRCEFLSSCFEFVGADGIDVDGSDRYDDGKSLEPSNPVIERIICECHMVGMKSGLHFLTIGRSNVQQHENRHRNRSRVHRSREILRAITRASRSCQGVYDSH